MVLLGIIDARGIAKSNGMIWNDERYEMSKGQGLNVNMQLEHTNEQLTGLECGVDAVILYIEGTGG